MSSIKDGRSPIPSLQVLKEGGNPKPHHFPYSPFASLLLFRRLPRYSSHWGRPYNLLHQPYYEPSVALTEISLNQRRFLQTFLQRPCFFAYPCRVAQPQSGEPYTPGVEVESHKLCCNQFRRLKPLPGRTWMFTSRSKSTQHLPYSPCTKPHNPHINGALNKSQVLHTNPELTLH